MIDFIFQAIMAFLFGLITAFIFLIYVTLGIIDLKTAYFKKGRLEQTKKKGNWHD
jgi:hypothetical protein